MKRKKGFALVQVYLIVSISFAFSFLIGNIGIVSAQEISLSTCLEDNDGAICQEYLTEICNSECKSDCFPGPRDDLADCNLGSCFDSVEGTCSANSPKSACQRNGGDWSEEEPAICKKICCIYEGNGEYITETACNRRERVLGVDTEKIPVESELECLILVLPDREGACVFEFDFEKNCVLTNAEGCLGRAGEFYQGFLCSHPDLETICEKQKSVSCVDGKEEVYWKDSCGNRENIYDSNLVRSYNNGLLQSKSDSCDLKVGDNPLANQGSCGNCDSFRGSICGSPGLNDVSIAHSELGDFVCKDLRCIDESGILRDDGESWCVYESEVGFQGSGNDGKSVDVPGARHSREVCKNGVIQPVPCDDFREEICIESPRTEEKPGVSKCIKNVWQACIDYNLEEDKNKMKELCEDDAFCEIKNVNVDSGFAYDTCVPRFPIGTDRTDERSLESAESVCGIASATCQIVYVKKLSGSYRCKKNCNCRNPEFAETMNNLCISLGDCGGYYNINEEFTKSGYGVGGKAPDLRESYIEGLKRFVNPSDETIVLTDVFDITTNVDLAFEALKSLQFTGRDRAGFSNNEIDIYLRAFKFDSIGSFLKVTSFFLNSAFGIGESKTRVSTFQCLPWIPPAGGDECEKCKDLENGCSKYKCQSLGENCKFENEGTSDEICFNSNPGDLNPPIIQPDRDVLTVGLEHFNVNRNGFSIRRANSECIHEFTKVDFGIKLDEPGRCRYSAERTKKFDDMGPFFSNTNNLKERHFESILLPSLDLLEVEGIDPERTGEYNLYLRCLDSSGNTQDMSEYVINFCVAPSNDNTAVILGGFDPITDSFISFDATEEDMRFYTNEPAECRWSLEDKDFDSMENQIDCNTDISEMTLFGWQCNTILPILEEKAEETYFIRCKDQPWLDDPDFEGDREGKTRNVNSESVEYRLIRSASELLISLVKPKNETIFTRFDPVPIELEIQTEGGADGKAICDFKINDGFKSEFFETGGFIHKQKLSTGLLSGDHVIDYVCVDKAENKAEIRDEIHIEIDDLGPEITRVYDQSSVLYIITDEEATCGFNLESCDFGFEDENVVKMIGENFVHTSEFKSDLTHYVKCKDKFENIGGCLTITGGFV